MADNIAQLVWIADESGMPQWCNRRWVEYTGVRVGETERRLIDEVIHPDHKERAARNTEICISRGEPFDDVYRIRGKDGNHRWFLTRSIPIRDEGGASLALVRLLHRHHGAAPSRGGAARGRSTEERVPRRPLARAPESAGTESGTASSSSTALLPARRRRCAPRRSIERQTQHLSRLVDELLDVTRISRGKIELNRVRLDLREVVRQTCEDHRSLFVHGDLAMRIDVPFDPVWIEADHTRIVQVVGKLLQNASKFTPVGGRVDVGLEIRNGRAEISVRDTGVGIEPAVMARLFTPFGQADRTLARTQGGLGLGLAVTKGLVELHGGTVKASSEGTGRGAEFVVALPLAPALESEVGVTETESPDPDSGGRSVLIIEDNVDAGDSLAEVLELTGHHVRVARDGQSGLAIARSMKPT